MQSKNVVIWCRFVWSNKNSTNFPYHDQWLFISKFSKQIRIKMRPQTVLFTVYVVHALLSKSNIPIHSRDDEMRLCSASLFLNSFMQNSSAQRFNSMQNKTSTAHYIFRIVIQVLFHWTTYVCIDLVQLTTPIVRHSARASHVQCDRREKKEEEERKRRHKRKLLTAAESNR